jgi:transposase-like protein
MGRKFKVSSEEKISAVRDYLSGKRGATQIQKELQIDNKTFRQWLLKYKLHGEDGLRPIHKNTFYSQELKHQAVQEYLSGSISEMQLCYKYKITNHSILSQWIKRYNSHETMRSQNSIGYKIMTTGRKTTFEERVEIVSFCIANGDNFNETAEKYQVSYQQVYTWTRKYKENGPEALRDKRGKRKNPAIMSESEKLAAQVKLLEAENKRLQMEVGFLKKLKEVEGRRVGKVNILPFKNTTEKPDSQ